jgi:uncharacterized protein (UPF0335 family)
VVVLDKTEYVNKMETIFMDSSAYKKLRKDPTKSLERKMNSELRKEKEALGNFTYLQLHSSDGACPEAYGLVKLHKDGFPLRPIVSYSGSPTYFLASWLGNVLSPLAGKTSTFIKSSEHFVELTRDLNLQQNEEIMSFDVIALFPSLPLDLALIVIEQKIRSDVTFSQRCPVSVDTFLSWIKLLFRSTGFRFNDSYYEQLKGTPMGSPISVVVSNLLMEYVEEKALSMLDIPPRFFRRFIDDCFAVVLSDKVNELHLSLNSVHPDIQFTIERSVNNKLPFLDVLVTVVDGRLCTEVYRKPMHSGKYLSFHSSHSVGHKRSVVSTLLTRAYRLTSDPSGIRKEIRKVYLDLRSNGYPERFINSVHRSVKHSLDKIHKKAPLDLSCVATIPYVPVISDCIGRILRSAGVTPIFRPIGKLSFLQKKRSTTPALENRNIVYRVDCTECDSSYIGQSSRRLSTRLSEHQTDVRKQLPKTALAKHTLEKNHQFDFRDVKLLAKNKTRFYDRIFCETFEIYKHGAMHNQNEAYHFPSVYMPLL